jgi:transposase
LHASQAKTDRVQLLRQEYWEEIGDIRAEDLVFIDETGVNLMIVRFYARALQGERATGERPEKQGGNVTLIGAMSLNGIVAALSLDGGINGDVFKYFIEYILVPNLWMGACVVMDNLSSHWVDGIRELIEAAGAKLVYLSPYSPDFNPIENCWSKVKAFLRSVGARSREALDQAITDALNAVTLKDIKGWFTYRCYCT